MPSPERSGRLGKAVIWEAASTINKFGQKNVYSPIEFDVRWEFTNRQVLDAQSKVVGVDVILDMLEPIAVDSIVWIGELADLPDPLTDLLKVVAVERFPDIKMRDVQYDVFCKRFRDSLPPIVGTGS